MGGQLSVTELNIKPQKCISAFSNTPTRKEAEFKLGVSCVYGTRVNNCSVPSHPLILDYICYGFFFFAGRGEIYILVIAEAITMFLFLQITSSYFAVLTIITSLRVYN